MVKSSDSGCSRPRARREVIRLEARDVADIVPWWATATAVYRLLYIPSSSHFTYLFYMYICIEDITNLPPQCLAHPRCSRCMELLLSNLNEPRNNIVSDGGVALQRELSFCLCFSGQ